VDPVLDDSVPLQMYEPGTWGPPEARALAAGDDWFDPSPAR
jgi:glucose-6-phosphate 1-dehydrogenase